jgi:hypothetical protein
MLNKNLKIYFSRDLRLLSFFSSFFLLCYPKLEKKISSFFLEFFWGDHIFFVKLISSFFSRFSFLEFHFVLYFYKISRFSVYRISRAFLSTKKSGILNSLDATFFLFEAGPHISKWWPPSFFLDIQLFLVGGMRRLALLLPLIAISFLCLRTCLLVIRHSNSVLYIAQLPTSRRLLCYS